MLPNDVAPKPVKAFDVGAVEWGCCCAGRAGGVTVGCVAGGRERAAKKSLLLSRPPNMEAAAASCGVTRVSLSVFLLGCTVVDAPPNNEAEAVGCATGTGGVDADGRGGAEKRAENGSAAEARLPPKISCEAGAGEVSDELDAASAASGADAGGFGSSTTDSSAGAVAGLG